MVRATDLSEAMQDLTEERLNKGMTLDESAKGEMKWESGCEEADANCTARAVFSHMTNEAAEAAKLLGGSGATEAAERVAAAAKKVSQLESEFASAFNAGESTDQ